MKCKFCQKEELPPCNICNHDEEFHDGGMGRTWCDGDGTWTYDNKQPPEKRCQCKGYVRGQEKKVLVYQVLASYSLVDSGQVMGIFSTKEKAERYAAKLEKEDAWKPSTRIETRELDKEE